MDPSETLANIRWLVKHHNNEDDTSELVNNINALDEWLSKGGFLPDDWSKGNG